MVVYLTKEEEIENIILLDHIEPRCDKQMDIYYRIFMNVDPVQLDFNNGRKWHICHGMRRATVNEAQMLLNLVWERKNQELENYGKDI